MANELWYAFLDENGIVNDLKVVLEQDDTFAQQLISDGIVNASTFVFIGEPNDVAVGWNWDEEFQDWVSPKPFSNAVWDTEFSCWHPPIERPDQDPTNNWVWNIELNQWDLIGKIEYPD